MQCIYNGKIYLAVTTWRRHYHFFAGWWDRLRQVNLVHRWQTITFGIVLFILGKFAWGPIMGSLKEREDSIAEALSAAQQAKAEMASLKAANEALLAEARLERDKMFLKTINSNNFISL